MPRRKESYFDTVLVPINKAGWPFIAIFLVASILLGLLAEELFWIGLIATAWCVYFFRDPHRVVPTRPGLIVAPSDGTVCAIEEAAPPAELELGDEKLTRVSIFLNVFDVHVNRVPCYGTVERVEYHPGKFFNASLDKASVHNERSAVSLLLPDGRRIVFVQIAGLVARRIINNLRPGQPVVAGERYGLIRFGSRMDVYLPPGVAPLVIIGQKTVSGETVIADLESTEPARLGVRR
jgi:phosphatidylserine decarboxylase